MKLWSDYTYNRINGFDFRAGIEVIGERVNQLKLTQLMETSFYAWDENGTPITGQAMIDYLNTRQGDTNALTTNRQQMVDWSDLPLTVNDPLNGQGLITDRQTAGVAALQGDDPNWYCLLATNTREFEIQVKDPTGRVLATKTWKYSWTNDPAKWVQGDPNPLNFAAGTAYAVWWKNDGKGQYYDIDGISGLLS